MEQFLEYMGDYVMKMDMQQEMLTRDEEWLLS